MIRRKMQARGTIKGITQDYKTGRFSVSIELTESDMSGIETLIGKDIAIDMAIYRGARSHSANALLWHCLGDIARYLGGDKWDYYLDALRKYGKYTMVSVRSDAVKAFKDTWRECEEVGRQHTGDEEWVHLLCYFGSSTYNSKEFSVLLDGVIEDMRQAGIPTPTSAEMKRVLDALERKEKGGE